MAYPRPDGAALGHDDLAKRTECAMPLSRALRSVLLTRPCPHCGHKLVKKGSWFQSMSRYRCGACHQGVRVPYEEKLKLFDDHAHLTDG